MQSFQSCGMGSKKIERLIPLSFTDARPNHNASVSNPMAAWDGNPWTRTGLWSNSWQGITWHFAQAVTLSYWHITTRSTVDYRIAHDEGNFLVKGGVKSTQEWLNEEPITTNRLTISTPTGHKVRVFNMAFYGFTGPE